MLKFDVANGSPFVDAVEKLKAYLKEHQGFYQNQDFLLKVADTAQLYIENNDNFTRASFRMEVSQYLSTIRSLGGIYDFRVQCDTTNNTPDVIDRNEFVASMFIKPAKSINYIMLNFTAVATGSDFDEIIGPANQA